MFFIVGIVVKWLMEIKTLYMMLQVHAKQEHIHRYKLIFEKLFINDLEFILIWYNDLVHIDHICMGSRCSKTRIAGQCWLQSWQNITN